LAKRVHEIAKELGVDSKAILAKCRAEDIPEDGPRGIKNHMSPVSAGLAETIKEWFSSAGGGTTTAVETAQKVDVETAKAKPKRAAKRPKSDEAGDHHGSDEQPSDAHVAPWPIEPQVSAPAAHVQAAHERPMGASVAATTSSAPAAAPEVKPEPRPRIHDESPQRVTHAGPTTVASPARDHAPAAPEAPARPRHVEPLAPRTLAPAAIAADPDAPAPHATRQSDLPAASAPDAGTAAGPSGPAAPPPRPLPGQPRPREVGPPPIMNVPRRPTVVQAAGHQLSVKAPVKLSGPKVVRVEAPEQIEAPRPRRAPTGAPGGGTGGPARPGDSSDRSRSPRRAKGGPGGGPSGPGGPGAPGGPGSEAARRRGKSGRDEPTWSTADLAELQNRLDHSGGYLKMRRQQAKQKSKTGAGVAGQMMQASGKVNIAAPFTIRDLSAATGVKASDIVKQLFLQGVPATINSGIDPVKAQELMIEHDIELEVVEFKTAEQKVSASFLDRKALDERPRGPVVTILGHVDHGKTSLLDKIRNANVAAGEAGGITQATSAFRVPIKIGEDQKQIVFLDTPGHQAFTAMRARGATMTDIVVLVVSAPEGVMPQTIESINHAKAAGVPIVVALNKIDRADATDAVIQRTLGKLAENGLNPVEWGGTTEVVRTSATTGKGVPELLEVLDLTSQLMELKADFGGPAIGSVIEAKVLEGRGAVANILVQQGELKVGDFVVMGRSFGRVRDITDDRGQRLKTATPPMPVQVSGIDEVCDAGDKFYVVDTLKKAQEAAEQRRHREREAQLAQPKLTLDSMFSRIADGDVKEIRVVLKADVQGSVDVLKSEIERVSTPEVKVRVLHSAVGGITESDVGLAEASQAVIVGFNVIASGRARSIAETKGIEIRNYQVIYDITDDMRKAAEGMLAPEIREEVLGHAEVREVFKITKVGAIAGCYITDGTVIRDALIRVTRSDIIVEDNRRLAQLKRFKDDAKEVRAGMECGMKIDGYDDIKVGDILECFKKVEVKRTL